MGSIARSAGRRDDGAGKPANRRHSTFRRHRRGKRALWYARSDNPAPAALRKKIAAITPDAITAGELGGSPITAKESKAPGNQAAIGGIRLSTRDGWVAARPSGTEDIYKIYAESFVSAEHLKTLQQDARRIVDGVAD